MTGRKSLTRCEKLELKEQKKQKLTKRMHWLFIGGFIAAGIRAYKMRILHKDDVPGTVHRD